METVRIFDIQRTSVHDGPGVRTTVFFKGCNLRCAWCHNPESQAQADELLWQPAKCVGCGACLGLCAARFRDGDRLAYCRSACTGCGRCRTVCPADAIEWAGSEATWEAVLQSVLRDKALYDISGGGVTFSGGEPMLQTRPLVRLLEALGEEGVHRAVDTAGNVPWASFEAVAPHTDLFLYDVKLVDERAHERYTGVGNARILENLRRLCGKCRVWVRIPLMEGVNSGEADAFSDLLGPLKDVERVELLAYHGYGEPKYRALNRPFRAFSPPTPQTVARFAEALSRGGVRKVVTP